MFSNRATMCSLAALTMFGGTTLGQDPAPVAHTDVSVLQAEVVGLREQVRTLVDRLDAATGPDWLDEQRADEIRTLVADVLSDADTRASLLSQSLSAGHDGSFFLASADGDFRLKIGGQIQFRYYAGFRDDAGGDDDFTSGFQNRRIKLFFRGHVFDPSLTYKIQGSFGRGKGGTFSLEDGYLAKSFENGVTVTVGQTKVPFYREELMSDTRLLAVERSLVNQVFSLGRSQGVEVKYDGGSWRGYAMFSDGAKANNTDFGGEAADYGLTARADLRFGDEWSRFKDYCSAPESALAARIGGAIHWEEGAHVPGLDGDDMLTYTADLQLEGDAWNALVAVVGRSTDLSAGDSFDDFGFVAQGGVSITDDIEPFARYSIVSPDSDRVGDSDLQAITVGANYYIHHDAVKLTGDLVWYPDATGDNDLITSATGLGLLSSTEGDQVTLRFQLQLLF